MNQTESWHLISFHVHGKYLEISYIRHKTEIVGKLSNTELSGRDELGLYMIIS